MISNNLDFSKLPNIAKLDIDLNVRVLVGKYYNNKTEFEQELLLFDSPIYEALTSTVINYYQGKEFDLVATWYIKQHHGLITD